MNATERETIVERIIVPLHRSAIDYVYEQCEAARHSRHESDATVTIRPLIYYDNGERLVEVEVSATRKAGVPQIVVDEAEADFRRAREVANVAIERYRAARDKVTQIRRRRSAYEARQTARQNFESFVAEKCNAICNNIGLPPNVLRDAQSTYGTTAARQGDEWSRHRPDPDTGEFLAPHEL